MTTPATTDKNNDNNTSSNTNNNSSNKKSNESRQQQRDMARTTTMAAGKASGKMREENIWHTLRRAKSVSRANLFWRKFHFTNRIDSYAFHFIFSLLTFCLSRPPDFPHFPPFPPIHPSVHHTGAIQCVHWPRSADRNVNVWGRAPVIVQQTADEGHSNIPRTVLKWVSLGDKRPLFRMLMKSALNA